MGNTLWNLYAKYYDATVLNFSAYHELLYRIGKEFDFSVEKSILNIGCGTGNLENFIAERNSEFRWLGIDQSEAMLNIARNKITNDGRFSFNLHDMNNLIALEANRFDYVVMINSLYAASNPRDLLTTVYEKLGSDGKLIISNPKETSSIMRMLAYEKKKRGFVNLSLIVLKLFPSFIINVLIRLQAGGGNYHFYSEDEMKSVLEEIGFAVTDLEDAYANESLLIIAKK